MNKYKIVSVLTLIVMVVSLGLMGCQKSSEEHPSAEHPNNEHPTSEHPTDEHPK